MRRPGGTDRNEVEGACPLTGGSGVAGGGLEQQPVVDGHAPQNEKDGFKPSFRFVEHRRIELLTF